MRKNLNSDKLCVALNLGCCGFTDFLSTTVLCLDFLKKHTDTSFTFIWPNLQALDNFLTFKNVNYIPFNNTLKDEFEHVLKWRYRDFLKHPTVANRVNYNNIDISKVNLDSSFESSNKSVIFKRGGGGSRKRHGELFTQHIELCSQFKETLYKKYLELQGDYVCMNFRMQEMYYRKSTVKQYNLDYNTDLTNHTNEILHEIGSHNKNILLCTDDITLLSSFKNKKRIYSFGYTNFLCDQGVSIVKYRPVHLSRNCRLYGLTQEQLIEFVLLDYFLMVFASKLIPSKVGGFGQSALQTREHFKMFFKTNDIHECFLKFMNYKML